MDIRYHINVFWLHDRWVANVPDVRFCSAHGATPTEAVAEVEVALEAWLDELRERRLDVESKPWPSD